ncbi:MAG: septal ring lytic transglycosylase RlpA family protein [Formosimonas sp.]
MIRLKMRQRMALTLSISAFVGLTSALSAKEVAAPVTNSAVADDSANLTVSPVIHVQKASLPATDSKLRALQSGVASYYGPGFHGRRTANGETFNMNAMTAAHRTLPFGTKLKVTNLNNGQSAIVRVNDRGPYVGGRVIDLSVAAAKQIGSTSSGTARVKLEVVEQ